MHIGSKLKGGLDIKKTIYKSAEGKAGLLALYDRQLESLNIRYEERYIDTRFGQTHLIVTGPEDGMPLLVFHGGNSLNPFSLKGILPLTEVFRIYAPDTPGHPGKSTETSLSAKNGDYGKWAADVINGLGYENMACLGGSYGGGIVVKLAEYAPERISKAVLIVPSGIANCSMAKIMINLGLPMCRYLLHKSRKNLIRAISPLASDPGEDIIGMVQQVFDNARVKAEMPSNATRESLLGFKAPVVVIAAEKDVMFPADAVIKRSKEIFSNLVSTEKIDGAPHIYTQKQDCTAWINERIVSFLLSGSCSYTPNAASLLNRKR